MTMMRSKLVHSLVVDHSKNRSHRHLMQQFISFVNFASWVEVVLQTSYLSSYSGTKIFVAHEWRLVLLATCLCYQDVVSWLQSSMT